MDLAILQAMLESREDEHLEFKEAKSQFDSEKLIEYCVALANEGGGMLVLGVTNARPRRVVGSQAFPDLGKKKHEILNALRIRVETCEVLHPHGRVVVFDIPARHPGTVMSYKGRHLMRSGESLVCMSDDQLRRILSETDVDFSASVCGKATLADIDSSALNFFREAWHRKSGRNASLTVSDEQLLADAELVDGSDVTYAALILLGTKRALDKYLPQAEVVFEFRQTESAGPAQFREEYRRGFFLFHEAIWGEINRRNDKQHFRDGLFVWDIPTFNEHVVREALLNAVSHRDYRLGGSVFVRQYPKRLEVESPGGFPPGITIENILYKQMPRNRRIAEVLSKCGLVERSGQGVNLMFEECIRETKPMPDYSRSDQFTVSLRLNGQVQDPHFLRFLERVGSDRLAAFTTNDLIVLDLINKDQPIPETLKPQARELLRLEVIERVGKGRGVRYILSQQFHEFLGKSGVHTRKKGLDRETNKALLLSHIEKQRATGAPLSELRQVLPSHTAWQVQSLLKELRKEGLVHSVGLTKAGRWFPGTPPAQSTGPED